MSHLLDTWNKNDANYANEVSYAWVLVQYPVLMDGKAPEAEKLEKFLEAVGWLNNCLKNNDYVTGNTVTIADHSLLATMTTAAATGEANDIPGI